MPKIRVKDLDIYYEVCGEGPHLLLIGGLGSTTAMWYGQLPFFSRYYTVITFDNRGAGESGKPPGSYTIEGMASDALSLLDHLGVRKTLVMGLSMGGMIAQALALIAPERVSALVLGCTHCGGKARFPPDPKVLEILTGNVGLTMEEIVDKDLPYLLSERFRREHPEEVSRYREVTLSQPLQPGYAYLAQLEAIKRFDCCARLSEVKEPVLVMSGSDDQVVPPENSRILAALIPRAKLVVFGGAGHAIHIECRDQLNEEVHEFFTHMLERGKQ